MPATGNNCAYIQVEIRPSVQPLADPARKRIVDGGKHSAQVTPTLVSWPHLVDLALNADDGIESKQFGGHGRTRQVDLPGAKGGDDSSAAAPRRQP